MGRTDLPAIKNLPPSPSAQKQKGCTGVLPLCVACSHALSTCRSVLPPVFTLCLLVSCDSVSWIHLGSDCDNQCDSPTCRLAGPPPLNQPSTLPATCRAAAAQLHDTVNAKGLSDAASVPSVPEALQQHVTATSQQLEVRCLFLYSKVSAEIRQQ